MPDPICTYLLPFRRARFGETDVVELACYLEWLGEAGCEVVVIDGSPPEVFTRHAAIFDPVCLHAPVDRRFGYLNDKVNGIHTGIELATLGKIILADDDIRYGKEALSSVVRWLDAYEVVRPQNFLRPLPWWGKMEAARMLINRALLRAADYPGTCAFRRATMLRAGHYDGDVLFDNEEIIRHFAVHGASIAYLPDLFVQKLPPTFRKWLEQRPRQAYEDFGLRIKTALFLGFPPLLIVAAAMFGFLGATLFLGLLIVFPILLTWRGRARGRAADFFPPTCCFAAPLWVAERTFSTYWALYYYFVKGGYPFGDRILSRGIGRAWVEGGRFGKAQIRAR